MREVCTQLVNKLKQDNINLSKICQMNSFHDPAGHDGLMPKFLKHIWEEIIIQEKRILYQLFYTNNI